MRSKAIQLIAVGALAVSSVAPHASAQNASTQTRTTNKILYHDGPVVGGIPNVYFVWYGCWASCGTGSATMTLLSDFMSTLGSTPYFQINSGYNDASGRFPSGALVYGGSSADYYSHGSTLTEADIVDVIAAQMAGFGLPQDPDGIYMVMTSADVTVQDGATGFCQTCCQLHGHGQYNGADFKWGFVGHTARCPGACGVEPNGINTPNDDLAGDSMAYWLAHTLSEIVTNPDTISGWYDRYGLENADKCVGTFGPTYPAANGATANIRLGLRDFLLQQNWVRGRKEHCGMTR